MPSLYLSQIAAVFLKITDPRHKRGVRHPFAGLLALVFLGTLAGMTEIAVIRRWVKKHWKELQIPLGFKRKKPAATTISRTLAQYSVEEFQAALAELFNVILAEQDGPIVAAVDGCEPHGRIVPSPADSRFEITFRRGDREAGSNAAVRGDKTNEPGCLKAHADELFAQYPLIRLLTGDATYFGNTALKGR